MDTKGNVPMENGTPEVSTAAAMSKTTTISTIAVQSGKTRIVIALLHVGVLFYTIYYFFTSEEVQFWSKIIP